jgi:orotidine-5'-phosphate decarboxylase
VSDAREQLIIALDVSSAAAARKIVAAVGDSGLTFKVGMQLYTAEGPRLVGDLVASGRRVFLDLKYHDIPNTVGAAVREAAGLGVRMLTVHAAGGSKMLNAAAEAAQGADPSLLLLGVTVLTSLKQGDLDETGVSKPLAEQVVHLARLALACGCGGVVSSAGETPLLRKDLGGRFAIVNPGVRPAGVRADDQMRVVTPADAISAGATHIVVGRPITEAADPAAQTRSILEQMSVAVAGS